MPETVFILIHGSGHWGDEVQIEGVFSTKLAAERRRTSKDDQIEEWLVRGEDPAESHSSSDRSKQ